MRNGTKITIQGTVLIVSLFLMAANWGGQGREEREALAQLQQSLHGQIAKLEREQDFLLFHKAMQSSESKYLILNLTSLSGQLKYKNRVLKDFRFSLPKKYAGKSLQAGMLVLSGKHEEKGGRHALIFGDALMLIRNRAAAPRHAADIPFISLPKRDMQSVYYAVEPGARAYVIR